MEGIIAGIPRPRRLKKLDYLYAMPRLTGAAKDHPTVANR